MVRKELTPTKKGAVVGGIIGISQSIIFGIYFYNDLIKILGWLMSIGIFLTFTIAIILIGALIGRLYGKINPY